MRLILCHFQAASRQILANTDLRHNGFSEYHFRQEGRILLGGDLLNDLTVGREVTGERGQYRGLGVYLAATGILCLG